MKLKEKLIGILLIALGAWPFLLKIESVGDFFSQYTFLEVLTPGEIIYQIVVIVLGAALIWRPKMKVQAEQNK